MPNLKENGTVVQELTESILDSKRGLDYVPGLMRRVIQEDMWQSRIFRQTGEIVEFERFTDFVTHRHYEGLGITTEALLELCRADGEVFEMVDRMIKGDIEPLDNHGGNRVQGSDTTLSMDRGAEYALARLKRDRPDLAERVINGELSPNAAAIEAGFRKRRISIPIGDVAAIADVVLKTLTLEQRIELATAILPTSVEE